MCSTCLAARSLLTPDVLEHALSNQRCLRTAWKLANLYLASWDAPMLSDGAAPIRGLSEATTCYVSMSYFWPASRFDDVVLHEAAHVFLNCKRASVGLREIRGQEWLLATDVSKRETFAYACETYGRIVDLGRDPAARRRLLAEVEDEPRPPDDRVDADAYIAIVTDAGMARNGWKRIHVACAS
jgi:hypothetical protein